MTSQSSPAAFRRGGAREKVLRAASDLFYQQGIRSVGVDTIIEHAQVAKTSLYRWFPAKDDLVVAFLQRRDALFWEQWDKVAEKYGDHPREQLLAQLRWIETYIGSDAYQGCPFIKASGEFFEADHPVRVAIKRHKEELRKRLQQLAQAAGAADPSLLADQLVLLINGAFASGRISGPRGPDRKLVTTGQILINAALGAA